MRWSDEEAAGEVRRMLGERLRRGEPAPANFGVVVGQTVDGVTAKHTLYRANRRVLRTPSAGRIARAIVRGLGEHEIAPPGPGYANFEAVVVVHGDEATLVDRRVAWVLDDRSAQLAKAGRRLLDTGIVRVDLRTAEVDLALPGDWDQRWRGVDIDSDRADRVEMREPAHRYALAGVVVGGPVDPVVPPVVSAMSLFPGPGPVALETVHGWIEVGHGVAVTPCRTADEIFEASTA